MFDDVERFLLVTWNMQAKMSILPIETSTGRRASIDPMDVNEQSIVDRAACSCRRRSALSIATISGGSTKGNLRDL